MTTETRRVREVTDEEVEGFVKEAAEAGISVCEVLHYTYPDPNLTVRMEIGSGPVEIKVALTPSQAKAVAYLLENPI